MILVSGTVTHATIFTSGRKTSLAMVFSWDLHMLSLPQSLDTFLVHLPTSLRQQPIMRPGQSVVIDELVNASRAVMPVHHPPEASGIAGCCVVAPERGTHDAPRVFLAPNGYAR